ncbi:MAG: hypothetical protein JO004_12780 [Methylobacteriaceae bacterium]|nr:hypothetical protein [Methylobacteriaceae bacterium]
MAETVADRADLLGATAGQEEQRGIIIVSGYVNRLVDDFCGNGFKLPFQGHGPRPPWWNAQVTGTDLLVMAAHFHRASEEASNGAVKKSLAEAADKLAKTGMGRL